MHPTKREQIDFDSRYPIYQQIVLIFSRALVRGELKPGERIPSVRDLSAALGVNANTAQRAYREMGHDGLIYSQRGMGYFITESAEITAKVKKTMTNRTTALFLEEMRALGCTDREILAELELFIKGGEKNGNNS